MLAPVMSPQDWIAISAVVATVVTALLGWLFSLLQQIRNGKERALQQKREDVQREKQQAREDELRALQQRREDEQRDKRREDAPHVELAINCEVLGQEGEDYAVEFMLIVYNRGLIRWTFRSILLRVRGIERNQSLVYWQGRGQRLEFPVKIVNMAEVIPKSVNYIFVEPGVQQLVTYTTKIPAQVKYIAVYVEFWYDKVTPHTSERVFRLTAPDNATDR
jgi:hypothetical protein